MMGRVIGILLCVCAVASGEEYVYEGRPAADWAKELKAGNNPEKAQHALSALGKDALPALVQLLRDPDDKTRKAALPVLEALKLDRETVAAAIPLLKDESYEVRRAAVRLLGKHRDADPAVGAALKSALSDKDRAVAEAAEEVLGARMKVDDEGKLRRRFDKLLGEAKASTVDGDMEQARISLDMAKTLGLNDPDAQARVKALDQMIAETAERRPLERKDERGLAKGKETDAQRLREKEEGQRKQQLEILLKQARIMLEKGDLDNAHRIALQAAKLFPGEERTAALLKQIEERAAAARARAATKKAGVGEMDPDDGEDKPGPGNLREGTF